MKVPLNSKRFRSTGFTLVELLIVLSIIGILTSIATPQIGSINLAATLSRSPGECQQHRHRMDSRRRCWHSMVAASRCVLPSGLSGRRSLRLGGAFDGQLFQVPNITGNDFLNARECLTFTNGRLLYNPHAEFTPQLLTLAQPPAAIVVAHGSSLSSAIGLELSNLFRPQLERLR